MDDMIRINLLPYREALRAEKNRQGVVVLVGILLIAAMIYYGIFQIFSAQVEAEHQQVQYLQTVSQHLKAEMTAIAELRKKRAALIAREGLITHLQDQRNQATQLFNALAKLTPPGVFLSTLKTSSFGVAVTGYAEGNADVAEFMRHVQQSKVFSHPALKIISRFKLGKAPVDRFDLRLRWRHKVIAKQESAS